MGRLIDHLVLCVNDLAAASRAWRDLGFTVTPQARHPFGTGNALVQFGNCYIELLAVMEPEKIGEADLAAPFSFAVYNRDFLRHQQGMSMLALQSRDAEADRDLFAGAGAAAPKVFHFSRDATLPDGAGVELAFSLAYASHPLLRNAMVFACQHRHPPQNFYFPEYQHHDNGAHGIGKVLLTHWAAEAVSDFYGAIEIGNLVDVLHSDELIAKYGIDDGDLPTDGFAGFEIIVEDVRAIAEKAKALGAISRKGRLILPPSAFFGVMIVFRGKQKAAR